MAKRHDWLQRRPLGSVTADWIIMFRESGIRERLERESPEVAALLDHLARHIHPHTDAWGWSVFNTWLDAAYRQQQRYEFPLPPGVTLLPIESVRAAVFPVT